MQEDSNSSGKNAYAYMIMSTATTRDKFLQIGRACVIWADPWAVAIVITIIIITLNPYSAFAFAFMGSRPCACVLQWVSSEAPKKD